MRKISVRRHKVKGELRWLVSRFLDGKRKRTIFDSKAAAAAEVARLQSLGGADEAWSKLTPERKAQVLKMPAPAATGKTLKSALAELVAAKLGAGKSERYLAGFKSVLNGFIKGREEMPISSITFTDCEAFMNTKKLAYRSTIRARLSTLFNFAVRRGYMEANPCYRLEAVTYVKPPPKVFTPMQVGRCVVWLRRNSPRALGWFVLTTFYGLRPEEAQQTSKSAINFKAGVVIVDAQTTKVRQRRVVQCPHPKALELLCLARDMESEFPINTELRRRTVRRLREVLGWEVWPKDVTRHTGASYLLAIKPNADYVSEQLGHSVKVLKRHYKALVTPEQAKRFWGRIRIKLPSK